MEPRTPSEPHPIEGSPGPDPFAGLTFPDKFKKDGKPDLPSFLTSYTELETAHRTKTEDLRKQIETDLFKARPESADKYVIPKIEGVVETELAENPMVAWWREEAFGAGMPQDKFEAGIRKYIELMTPQPISEEDLKRDLGENFKQRIAAVDAWAVKTAKSQGEMDALKQIATSADGIKVMERLMGVGSDPGDGGYTPPANPVLTLEQLRSMQQDARYWNPTARDPAFVKQVEDGYKKLYPETKKSA